MPLSEHEQRVLAQMEKALHAEDPRLASQLRRPAPSGAAGGLDRRRLALGVVIALVGLGLIVAGVMFQLIWVGAIGFLAMVLGGAWAATPARRGGRPDKPGRGAVTKGGKGAPGGTGASGPGASPKKPRQSGGFMDRMEQQWDKRKEQGPF